MKKIIDISYWQPPAAIDYDRMAGDVSGVILRGVYGIWKDTAFETHYRNLTERGIPLGVYHYIIGNQSARAQAEAIRNVTQGKVFKMGCWADIEDTRAGTTLTRPLVVDYMKQAEAFVGVMGIYTSRSKWDAIMQGGGYNSRKLWIANYGVLNPALPIRGGWTSWWLWQYSDDGDVSGITGSVDVNKWHGSDAEYQAWVGGEPVQELTVVEKVNRLWAAHPELGG